MSSRRPPLPEAITDLLRAHHAGGVVEADCLRCTAACCLEPGFAILENLIPIHSFYRRGGLAAAAVAFERGLSLCDFALRYFDLTTYRAGVGKRRRSLLLFHARARSATGEPIAIPELGDYWEVRAELFGANPWLSRGCVFQGGGGCLLHERGNATRLGRKPIDCAFFTCEEPLLARLPDSRLTARWLDALALAYPGSIERFEALEASHHHHP
jgi:hypothetical protein